LFFCLFFFFDLDLLSVAHKNRKFTTFQKNREEIIRVLPSNTVEEMETNVEGVVEWAAAFEKEAASKKMGSESGGASEERGGSE
jgi:hypothetical protein